MAVVVCDTSVVSDLSRGGDHCRLMSMLDSAVKVVSVVTVAELRAGAIKARWGERRVAELEAVIRAYPQVTIDDEVVDGWARLWAASEAGGRNVGHNDLWIAATAVRIGAVVASLDGDFGRIPGIRLLDGSGVERQTE